LPRKRFISSTARQFLTLNSHVSAFTARGDDADRIAGLEAGADDYLPKPFNPRELVARIRAVLGRRAANPPLEILSESALGRPVGPLDRSIDNHISNLRKKLGPEVNGIERIRNIRGTGYCYTGETA
jgi:DNA-binding response OmpR family regulator